MPVLKNARHELFAQEVVKAKRDGRTQGDAYHRAGFVSVGNVAEAAASRMLNDPKNGTYERVLELLGRGAKRAEVSVESLIDKLEANIIKADKRGQHSAVNGAIGLLATLKGLLINRTEVGNPGDFEGLTSVEAVVNKVRGEAGDEAADALILVTTADKHEQLAILDRMRERITTELGDDAMLVGVRVGIEADNAQESQ
jgi:hypothetical protein